MRLAPAYTERRSLTTPSSGRAKGRFAPLGPPLMSNVRPRKAANAQLEGSRMTATCACGQASITVNAVPTMHGVCHCTNCKRRTGSAFGISAYFDRAAVVEQTGETNVYAFHHAPQDHDQERHFCSACGTTLFWFVSALPEKIGIAGGCFADGGLPEPTYSVTERKREAWVSLPPHWQAYQQ